MLRPTDHATGRALTPAQMRGYNRGLGKSHWREIEYVVTDLNHKRFGRAEVRVLEGGVSGDRKASPSLTLDATILDPGGRLPLEPDDAAGLAIHRKRMLKVIDSRYIEEPEYTGWADCPVFTGPITDISRNGPELKIIAGDKSVLAQGDTVKEMEFPRKGRVTKVATALLQAVGETRIRISPSEAKLAKRLTIPRYTRVWPRLRKLAKGRGRVAMATADGFITLRRLPKKVSFTAGKALVLSVLEVDPEASGDRPNRWLVVGGKPKGEQDRVRSKPAALPAWHPDSSWQLARGPEGNRKPFVRLVKVEEDQIKSVPRANAEARRRRDDAVRRGQTLGVEIAPVPHLELGDLVRVVTPDRTTVIRNEAMFLPLGSDGGDGRAMTIGVDRRVSGGRGKGGRGGKGRGGKGKQRRFRIVKVNR